MKGSGRYRHCQGINACPIVKAESTCGAKDKGVGTSFRWQNFIREEVLLAVQSLRFLGQIDPVDAAALLD